jgi:hypothetical protein
MSKWMNLQEFVDSGFLQEANRQFFHPLGLALAVEFVVKDGDHEITGLAGIRDSRDDIEGYAFSDNFLDSDDARKKAATVEEEHEKHVMPRCILFGDAVQPIPK